MHTTVYSKKEYVVGSKSQNRALTVKNIFSLSPLHNSHLLLFVNYEAVTLEYRSTKTEEEKLMMQSVCWAIFLFPWQLKFPQVEIY